MWHHWQKKINIYPLYIIKYTFITNKNIFIHLFAEIKELKVEIRATAEKLMKQTTILFSAVAMTTETQRRFSLKGQSVSFMWTELVCVFQTQFKGNSRQFSEAMLQSGMYRDHGFNTSVERSRVMVSTATQNSRVNLHRYYHYGNQSSDLDRNNK